MSAKITMTETCSCGAAVSVTADYIGTIETALRDWRERHRAQGCQFYPREIRQPMPSDFEVRP